jgi:hypothetical protein
MAAFESIFSFSNLNESVLNHISIDIVLFLRDLFSKKFFSYSILNKQNFITLIPSKEEEKEYLDTINYDKIIDLSMDHVCDIKYTYEKVSKKYSDSLCDIIGYAKIKKFFNEQFPKQNIYIYISSSCITITSKKFVYSIKIDN